MMWMKLLKLQMRTMLIQVPVTHLAFSQNTRSGRKISVNTYTTRVVVNQAQAATNTGSWTSGMPFTSSLGCGTWGGNIASENIVLKHYMNNTWVIREIPSRQPTDEELFEGFSPR